MLAEIILDTVKPHGGGENRFRIEGPDLRLSPNAALAIAMALHELGTNAAKYGALSKETGQVAVVWRDRRRKVRTAGWSSIGKSAADRR